MDPVSIVEDTKRRRFCPQMDRWTDGRTDGQGETSIPHFQLEARGMIKMLSHQDRKPYCEDKMILYLSYLLNGIPTS